MSTYDVCADGDIDEGGHVLVDIGGGIEVAVFLVEGQYYAIDDICTHDNGPLADGRIEGLCVVCPRHGAMFDLRTGEAVKLPAYRPIDTFPVRLEGDRIVFDA